MLSLLSPGVMGGTTVGWPDNEIGGHFRGGTPVLPKGFLGGEGCDD